MKPAIIAHRGASTEAPENTLAAFRLAWAQDADAVEMDLWPTADGRLAVIHDPDLQRVAGIRRNIGSLDASALKEYDVGAWKHARWAGERVPLLGEVLALVPSPKRVFLELKGGEAMLPELERCIGSSGLEEAQIGVIAFDRALLVKSKCLLPGIEHGLIVDWPSRTGFDRLVERAAEDGFDALDFSAKCRLTPQRVACVHDSGLKVYVWTVDDAAKARQLARAGVDGITTNAPAMLRNSLGLA